MYNYEVEKAEIFSEQGQKSFLEIRDKVKNILAKSGAITMDKAISDMTGINWFHMACVDRLVELKELKEISQENVAGQNRIFVLPFN